MIKNNKPTLSIDGNEWMELLTTQEIADAISIIEQYHRDVISIGKDKAIIKMKEALSTYINKGGA